MSTISDKVRAARAAAHPAPPLTPGRVEHQRVASVVHIRHLAAQGKFAVRPDLAHLYYTHDRTLGDEMKPHRMVWFADFKRHPGELVTIRLCTVPPPPKLLVEELLASPRATPKAGAPPLNTWVIRHDENAVETQAFVRTTDDFDRINVKYEIEFTSPTRTIETLDPDINLIPDP